jgi:hypothetical protein
MNIEALLVPAGLRQATLGEIPTRIHQLLVRPVLLAHTRDESRDRAYPHGRRPVTRRDTPHRNTTRLLEDFVRVVTKTSSRPCLRSARASLRRQRPGGDQERRGDPQAHRVRLHRRETRGGGRSIPPGAPEPLCELLPAVRHTKNPHRGQRQATARLPRWATPFEMFRTASVRQIPAARVTLAELDRFAQSQSDTEAALEMQHVKRKQRNTA